LRAKRERGRGPPSTARSSHEAVIVAAQSPALDALGLRYLPDDRGLERAWRQLPAHYQAGEEPAR
jgi:hypothetical protein